MTGADRELPPALRRLLDDGAGAIPGSEEYEVLIREAVRASRRADKPGDSVATFEALRAEGIDDDRLLVHEAFALLRVGHSAEALPLLDRVIARASPGDLRSQALRLRAKGSADLGDLRGSVADGRRALSEGEVQSGLLRSTIERSRRVGDWEGAVELVASYRSHDEDLAEAAAAVEADGLDTGTPEGIVAMLEHRRPSAVEDISALGAAALDDLADHLWADVERNDQLAGAWRRLGEIELGRKNLDAAEECFSRYARLIPGNPAGPAGLARVHVARGQWLAAITTSDRAVALPGRDIDARLARAQAAAELEDPVMTITLAGDLDSLVRRVSDPAQARRLQVLLDGAGRHDEATAFGRMAGSHHPETGPDEGDRSDGDLVLYTVLTGSYDVLADPRPLLPEHVRFVVLTDSVADLPRSLRTCALSLDSELDPQAASRHPKMLPHEYFPDAERSIYIDANFHLLADPTGPAAQLSIDTPITVLRHVDRDSPAEEIVAVVERGFANWEDARAQLGRQVAAGFDPYRSQLSYGGYLVRHHGSEPLRRAMNTWWESFLGGIRRDQTSLDFALWSADVDVQRLPLHNHRNDYWIRLPHV